MVHQVGKVVTFTGSKSFSSDLVVPMLRNIVVREGWSEGPYPGSPFVILLGLPSGVADPPWPRADCLGFAVISDVVEPEPSFLLRIFNRQTRQEIDGLAVHKDPDALGALDHAVDQCLAMFDRKLVARIPEHELSVLESLAGEASRLIVQNGILEKFLEDAMRQVTQQAGRASEAEQRLAAIARELNAEVGELEIAIRAIQQESYFARRRLGRRQVKATVLAAVLAAVLSLAGEYAAHKAGLSASPMPDPDFATTEWVEQLDTLHDRCESLFGWVTSADDRGLLDED